MREYKHFQPHYAAWTHDGSVFLLLKKQSAVLNERARQIKEHGEIKSYNQLFII